MSTFFKFGFFGWLVAVSATVKASELKPGAASCYGADGYISVAVKVDKDVKATISRFYLFSREEPNSRIFSFEITFPGKMCQQNASDPSIVSCIESEVGAVKLAFKDFDGNALPAPEGVNRVLSFSTYKTKTMGVDPAEDFLSYHFATTYMKGLSYGQFGGKYAFHAHQKPCQFKF